MPTKRAQHFAAMTNAETVAIDAEINTEEELIDRMTTPSAAVAEAVAALSGTFMVLGAGGKMGPALAELLVRAGADEVIGVARFSQPGLAEYLREAGVRPIVADLMDDGALDHLPSAENILLLVGYKFGATGDPTTTWAVNAALPGRVVARYRTSRIVYVSSGNVYAFADAASGGSREQDPLGPVGEYAQSRLGGERIAAHAAMQYGTSLFIARLFYATELRYGIIRDLADRVLNGQPIDLTTGCVNQIWQGDANAYLARSFPLCSDPPTILNLTGDGTLSVRDIATKLGQLLDREPIFTGRESANALLGDASALRDRLGLSETPIDAVIRWVAHWVQSGGSSLGKPTKYESRTGTF